MLVRNLSRTPLKIKSFNGKKVVLPPMKVIELDSLDFPAERVKKLFGKYVQILTEKATENDVPTETKEDMELQKGTDPVQPANETVAKKEETETAGAPDNDKDTSVQDPSNDDGVVDPVIDDVLAEVKDETGKEEKPVEAPKAKKATKKPAKKTTKK